MAQTNTQDSNYDRSQKQRIDKEVFLLATIQENSQLPEKEQQRYQHLWRKCENETLSQDELIEYQSLLSQLETRNLKRIEALIALAQSKEKTLAGIAAGLGLKDGESTSEENLI